MKNRIFSIVVTLVLAVSMILGVAIAANAEGTPEAITDTSLNLAENITVYMNVSVPDGALSAKITLPNGEVDNSQTIIAGTNCVLTAEVAVKDFAKTITVDILGAEDAVLATSTTSAKAYCERYKTKYPTGEFLTLIEKLEAYGEAAKAYFEKGDDAAEGAVVDLSTIKDIAFGGTIPAGLTHRSATLLLESETAIRHYFELEEGKKIENYIFYVDLDNDGKRDNGETLRAKLKADNIYYVDIAGITPNELNVAYTLGVIGREDAKEYSCTYGAFTYLKRVYGDEPTNNMKNLVAALYNYSAEAGKLTGTITFNANGGTEVITTLTSYKYGITTPVVATTTKAGSTFLGWYNGDKLVTEIPASWSGPITLTAKWGTPTTSYDVSAKSEGNRFLCPNHVAPEKDQLCDYCGMAEGSCSTEKAHTYSDGQICKTCGWCVGNANCTIDVSKIDVSTACANCLQTGRAAGERDLAGLSSSGSNDKAAGYMRKITLADGKEVALLGVDGRAFYQSMYGTDSLANIKAAAAGNLVYSISVEVGFPTEAQYEAVELNPSQELGDKKAGFFFRFSGSGSDMFFTVTSGGEAYIADDKSKTVKLPEGDVTKLTIVFDFTGAVSGDDIADTYRIMLYDEEGNLINSKICNLYVGRMFKDWKTGELTTSPKTDNKNNTLVRYGDISALINTYLFQFRINNGAGRFLIGDININEGNPYNGVFNASDASCLGNYTAGNEFVLPETMTKDGYVFDGWYADANYTQPIEKVGANAFGGVFVYPKWNKIVAKTEYNFGYDEDTLISYANWCDHIDANEDNICDKCTRCVAHVNVTDGICEQCGYKVSRCSSSVISGKTYHNPDYKSLDGQGNLVAGTVGDGLCDNCGKAADACTCGDGAFVDVTKPDGLCDLCYRNNATTTVVSGALGKFSFSNGGENSSGYTKAIIDGDKSYLQINMVSGSGPSFSVSTSDTISVLMESADRKVMTYSMELMAEEGQKTLPVALRIRNSGDGITAAAAYELFDIKSDGKLYTTSDEHIVTLSTTEMTKISVVVDFDNREFRYYVNDLYAGSHAISELIADYTKYTTAQYGQFQLRMNGNGVMNIDSASVQVGDLYE